MKKILLSITLLFSLFVNAQDFWNPVSPFPDQGFYPLHISAVNAQVIWINGHNYQQTANTSRKFFRSTDGGSSWTEGTINLGSENLYINSICAVSGSTAYVSANSNVTTVAGGLWVTHDSGNTWSRQSPVFGLNTFITFNEFQGDNFVHFWNAQNGVVISNPENDHFIVYTTLDSGNNWIRVSDVDLPTALPEEKGHMIKCGVNENSVWFGTSKGRIFKSNDKGIHWTVSQMPPMAPPNVQNELSDVAFKNDTDGILVTNLWMPYSTTDNGNNWHISYWNYGSMQPQVVYVPETSDTYFSYGEESEVNERASSFTTDNGQSWTQLNNTEVNPVAVQSCSFLNNTIGFCVGYYHLTNPEGGLYFYKLGDDAFSRLLKTDDQISENRFSAAPNPATDMVKIYGKNIKSVTVFDVSGKKVLTKNYGISDDISLDISKLQNGIYLAEITNISEVTSTIKIVKK